MGETCVAGCHAKLRWLCRCKCCYTYRLTASKIETLNKLLTPKLMASCCCPASVISFHSRSAFVFQRFYLTWFILKRAVRGKYVTAHAMKAYMGSRNIATLILTLGARWAWRVNFTLRPLHPWEITPETHWLEVWVGPRTGLYVTKKIVFCSCRDSNAGPSNP